MRDLKTNPQEKRALTKSINSLNDIRDWLQRNQRNIKETLLKFSQ